MVDTPLSGTSSGDFQVNQLHSQCGDVASNMIAEMIGFRNFIHVQAAGRPVRNMLKNIRMMNQISVNSHKGEIRNVLTNVQRRFVVAHITHLQVKQVPQTPAMKLKRPAALLSFTSLQTLCLDLDFRRRREFTSFWNCIAKMNLGDLTIGALPHQVTQAKFIPGLQLHLRLAFSDPPRIVSNIQLLHGCQLGINQCHFMQGSRILRYCWRQASARWSDVIQNGVGHWCIKTNPERSFEATPQWHAAGVQVIEYNVFDSPNHWEDE
jgi:hypothetical protein